MDLSRGGLVAQGTLRAIVYTPAKSSPTSFPTLQILDQLALPHQTIYIPISGSHDAFAAIKNMSIRGAPAIAIVAALSVVVEISVANTATLVKSNKMNSPADWMNSLVVNALEYLLDSRPTAVNLRDAVTKLIKVTNAAARTNGADVDSVRMAYVNAAEKMLVDDVNDNQAIGRFGADWIKGNLMLPDDGKIAVLTHCNTGFVFLFSSAVILLMVMEGLWRQQAMVLH